MSVLNDILKSGFSKRYALAIKSAFATREYSRTIKSGTVATATSLTPPGLRISQAITTNLWIARVGTAPTGATMIVVVKRAGSTIATITIAISATSGSVTTAVSLAAGDVLTFDVTQVGSTVAGADLEVTVVGTLT